MVFSHDQKLVAKRFDRIQTQKVRVEETLSNANHKAFRAASFRIYFLYRKYLERKTIKYETANSSYIKTYRLYMLEIESLQILSVSITKTRAIK